VKNNKKKCVLINYADSNFIKEQKKNSRSGGKVGKFRKVISYGPKDIDEYFYSKNKSILSEKRGGGYWLWKPYFIQKQLRELNIGEYLLYCDSGSYFIRDIENLVKSLEASGQDIMPFDTTFKEQDWTKRDAFLLLECDKPYFAESNQRGATFMLFKKSKASTEFVDEWLSLAQDERLITDIDNTLGRNNYVGFKEHRHDQSIYSLLTKKKKLQAFRNPGQQGNDLKTQYPNSKYDQIIEHTRRMGSFVTQCANVLKRTLRWLQK